MIKNILCPVDRSPRSLQAFDRAIAIARWQGARLHLLEVIEPPASGGSVGPEPAGASTGIRAALERDLQRMLVSRRAWDVKVEIVMREGNVVREILAEARDSRADLVVMGSHGRGRVPRPGLGSTAEKVLRQATCPVLTVRRGVSRVRRNRSPFKTILCPTDLPAAGNSAVAYAKRLLARARSADLIVMGVSGHRAVDVVRLGSTTHHVIRRGEWPVLTVPPGPR
jgi:nucleotide-binding universal stress UspA family protein